MQNNLDLTLMDPRFLIYKLTIPNSHKFYNQFFPNIKPWTMHPGLLIVEINKNKENVVKISNFTTIKTTFNPNLMLKKYEKNENYGYITRVPEAELTPEILTFLEFHGEKLNDTKFDSKLFLGMDANLLNVMCKHKVFRNNFDEWYTLQINNPFLLNLEYVKMSALYLYRQHLSEPFLIEYYKHSEMLLTNILSLKMQENLQRYYKKELTYLNYLNTIKDQILSNSSPTCINVPKQYEVINTMRRFNQVFDRQITLTKNFQNAGMNTFVKPNSVYNICHNDELLQYENSSGIIKKQLLQVDYPKKTSLDDLD